MLSAVRGNGLGEEVNASILAHHESFRIGAVEVRPATKTVLRDGRETVVEPRVMQVLVALAEAKGAVVSRDDLVAGCWDGRIVGDDSINRIMSRLRRLASDVGANSFVIETVTKVGYRLRLVEGSEDITIADTPPIRNLVDRRTAVAALVAAPVALGVGLWSRRSDANAPPPEARALFDQALLAYNQNTREGQSQAVGILRRLVETHPNYADAWGALGMTYASVSHFRSQAEGTLLQQRARTAARRGLSIDADNGFAAAALTVARPTLGNWYSKEQALRSALRRDPKNVAVLNSLSGIFMAVGRIGESLALQEQVIAKTPPSPGQLSAHIRSLWYAGRLDETDRALARALELYPTHYALWFTRFYAALYSGRPDASLALAEDRAQRPSGIPEDEIASVMRVAQALLVPNSAAIDAIVEEQLQRARSASGHAENAIQFLTALGRPDVAFAILRAYHFEEGFVVPEIRFNVLQGSYTPRNDRQTIFLFAPSLAPLRRTADFAALTERLGLEKYWREAGIGPDYRLG